MTILLLVAHTLDMQERCDLTGGMRSMVTIASNAHVFLNTNTASRY